MLNINNISKTFYAGKTEIPAVIDVTLKIEKGDFVSIIGHSGSGKTTLLSIMGGILRPTAGEVLIEGKNIFSMNDAELSGYRADRVGYVFQFASLLPVLSARENMMLPTLFGSKHTSDAELEEKVKKYLGMMGIEDKIDAYPYQLSGGQQRRVAIARTLMNDPDIIIADEPTGDLDEETEADVMKFFKHVNGELGVTFIMVTHSRELARGAEVQLKMEQGRIVEV